MSAKKKAAKKTRKRRTLAEIRDYEWVCGAETALGVVKGEWRKRLGRFHEAGSPGDSTTDLLWSLIERIHEAKKARDAAWRKLAFGR